MGEPAEKGGSGGDGFSGIDPERLAKTIQSIDKDQGTIMTSVGWIKSSFERYGVGVEPLTELKSIAGWAEEQLPMLRRRHHLSIAEDEKYGHGYKGMVRIQESMVGQTKQSLKDGKELGNKFKESLNDGDDPSPEMYADLRAHKGDADYVKAFYDELGPQRVAWLSTAMGDRHNDRYKDHPDEREKDRSVIADTFGTYTKVAFEGKSAKAKQQAWNKWFSDSSLDEYEGFRPDRLTPFLKGGSQDKDFLVAFSDRVLDKKKQGKTDELRFFGNNQTGEGEWGKDNYQQLFDAVSENPEAAGEAMDHNYDFVQNSLYDTGPWKVDEPKERGKAFFNMVNAATVTLKQSNPSLAEKNTGRILFDNYQNRKGKDGKGHPIEGTQALYASILTAYWKDLEHGVTSPAGNTLWGSDIKAKGEEKYATTTKWSLQDFMKGQDSGRRGLEASDSLWRALMEESARDPKAAGTLSALFQRYDEKALDHAYSTEKSTEHAGAFDSMKRGMMQEFYQESMKTASGEIEGDIDKWVDDTNKFRAKIIDTAGEVALGATGGAGIAGAKGAAVGVAWGLGSGVATGLLKDLVKADANDAPKGLKEAFKGVKENTADFSWQTDYQNNADAAREHDKIKPVTIESDGKDGGPKGTREYTGDVKDYAKGDANFLNKKGEIKDIGDMSTAERTAYNKWLQDPAVVAAIWPEYSRGRNARDYPGQDS